MSWSGYSYVKREGETSSSMVQYTWTTCSKVIQFEVTTLQTELQRLLGKNLLGIYLHGSCALGGFQPGRSDIDVIVVTAQRVDLETKRRCIEPLLRISKKCRLRSTSVSWFSKISYLSSNLCPVIFTIVKSGARTIIRIIRSSSRRSRSIEASASGDLLAMLLGMILLLI